LNELQVLYGRNKKEGDGESPSLFVFHKIFLGGGQFNGELNCPGMKKSFVGGVRIFCSQ